jgi:hypothetical protein
MPSENGTSWTANTPAAIARKFVESEYAPWVFGGLAVLGFLFAPRSQTSATDALTRMLIAETDFGLGEAEMTQIVFVALNRSKQWGMSLASVVAPGARSDGRSWNADDRYRTRYMQAPTSSRWGAAKAFVERVLRGDHANAGYTFFVHPRSLSAPPCASNRVEADTIAGRRCIPARHVSSTVIGRTMFV